MNKSSYGFELILDLHDCYETRFNRRDIKRYFEELCDLIDMKRCKLEWWDYFWWPKFLIQWLDLDSNPRTYGTSATQFIMTSNITIHVLDELRQIYINIFSCKDFDAKLVADFSACYFWGEIVNQTELERI